MKTPSTRRAFTLVEVMVSLAVLSFILLILGGLIELASNAWQGGMGRANNFTKSRAMLDLVASDLQHAVVRSDLPIFQTAGIYNSTTTTGGFSGGQYSASFFTMIPGVSRAAVRDLSCVSYSILATNDSDKIVLQRSELPITWSTGASVPFQGDLATSLSTITPQEMAPGVVGFQFAFRHTDGTVSTTYTGYVPNNPVIAVGVSLAVIGDGSLGQLSKANLTSIQTSLTADLANASPLKSVKEVWDSNLTSSFYAQYPKTLGPNLQTFERWVVCTTPF